MDKQHDEPEKQPTQQDSEIAAQATSAETNTDVAGTKIKLVEMEEKDEGIEEHEGSEQIEEEGEGSEEKEENEEENQQEEPPKETTKETVAQENMATIIAAATRATTIGIATGTSNAPAIQPAIVVGATQVHTDIDHDVATTTREMVDKTLAAMTEEELGKQRQKQDASIEAEKPTVVVATQVPDAPATTAGTSK